MRRKVLFLVPSLGAKGQDQGIFSCLAVYQLKAYLESLARISQDFSFHVEHVSPFRSQQLIWRITDYTHTNTVLLTQHPDVVCFSMYVWNVEACAELARSIRLLLPKTLIVAGGPEVASRQEFVKDYDEFDVLVEGDGEIPLAMVLSRVSEGRCEFHEIPGVSWRTPEGYAHGPENSTSVDYEEIPNVFELNKFDNRLGAHLASTRGCEEHCTYCLWCKKVPSRKSDAKVLSELNAIVSAPTIEGVWFSDSDFNDMYHNNPALFAGISDLLRKHAPVMTEFSLPPGALLDPDMSDVLKALSVRRIFTGVQSMNPQVLRNVGRGWSIPSLDCLARVPEEVKKYVVCELMFPLPGETLASFLEGVQRLWDAGMGKAHIFPVLALRGTPLRRQVLSNPGYIVERRAPHLVMGTPTFSPEEWAVAAAVSHVITTLSQAVLGLGSAGHQVLRGMIAARGDGVAQIATLFREGVSPFSIIEKLIVEYPGSERFEREYAGVHLAALYDKTSEKEVEAERSDALTSWAPAEGVLENWLSTAGLRLESMAMLGDSVNITVLAPTGPIDLILRPASSPGAAFATVAGLKVSYSGHLGDVSIMGRLVDAARRVLK